MLSESELTEVQELARAYEVRQVQAAMEHAYRAHDEMGQTYGVGPYSDHLRHVDNTLCGWLDTMPTLPHKLRATVRVGGVFHDWFEDCHPAAELHPGLALWAMETYIPAGIEIALLCTDPPGISRTERKALAYPRIRLCYGALLVKLADRISNLKAARTSNSRRLLERYVEEHVVFTGELLGIQQARLEQLRPLYLLARADYLKVMEVARLRLDELVASSDDTPRT